MAGASNSFCHNIQADEALEEFRATSMSTSKVITRWIHLTQIRKSLESWLYH